MFAKEQHPLYSFKRKYDPPASPQESNIQVEGNPRRDMLPGASPRQSRKLNISEGVSRNVPWKIVVPILILLSLAMGGGCIYWYSTKSKHDTVQTSRGASRERLARSSDDASHSQDEPDELTSSSFFSKCWRNVSSMPVWQKAVAGVTGAAALALGTRSVVKSIDTPFNRLAEDTESGVDFKTGMMIGGGVLAAGGLAWVGRIFLESSPSSNTRQAPTGRTTPKVELPQKEIRQLRNAVQDVLTSPRPVPFRASLPNMSKSQVESLTESDKRHMAEDLLKSQKINLPEGVTYTVKVRCVGPEYSGNRRRLPSGGAYVIVITFLNKSPQLGNSVEDLSELKYGVVTVELKIHKVRNNLERYLKRRTFLRKIQQMHASCRAFYAGSTTKCDSEHDSNLHKCIKLKFEFYGENRCPAMQKIVEESAKGILGGAWDTIQESDRVCQKDFKQCRFEVGHADMMTVDARKLFKISKRYIPEANWEAMKKQYKKLSPGLEKDLKSAIQMDIFRKLKGIEYDEADEKTFNDFIHRLSLFYSMPQTIKSEDDTDMRAVWSGMDNTEKEQYLIALKASVYMSFQDGNKDRVKFLREGCLSQLDRK